MAAGNMMFRGVYQVSVNVKLQNYKQVKPVAVNFKVTVIGNTAPKVNGFVAALKLKPGEEKKIALGTASDDEQADSLTLTDFKTTCSSAPVNWIDLTSSLTKVTQIEVFIRAPDV
jgi:uncharacterized membrane protein